MSNISGAIVVYNEEKLLARCLENMQKYCDEIVLYDSYSTDKTLDIAKQFNCRVFTHEFDNHRDQKNRVIDACKCDWVFLLDADEYANELLTATLKSDFIKSVLEAQQIDALGFPRYNILDGEGPKGWPDVQTRLFRKYVRHGGHPHHHATNINARNHQIAPISSGLYIVHDKDMDRQKRQNRLYYFSRPMDYATPPEGAEDMVIPPERYFEDNTPNLYRDYLSKEAK